jgi:hypothetical protein
MAKNLMKIVAMSLLAYGIFAMLPDIKRYIRISTM